MSQPLQKAIVYELFAIFLAVVICAYALAGTVAYGYVTGPWIALVVPVLIALFGLLKALVAGGDREAGQSGDSPSVADRGDDGDDGGGDHETPSVAELGHPPH